MAYLIDGHNLIPKVAGLSLQAVDDEKQLIEILQVFSRLQRRKVDVFFDKAAPGQVKMQRYGMITAHFVHQGSTADDAISAHLRKLNRNAPNWTVISSDRQVQAEAHAAGAKVISSEQFAAQLHNILDQQVETDSSEATLGKTELEEWLRLFGSEDL
jgi:uncharacterized protein